MSSGYFKCQRLRGLLERCFVNEAGSLAVSFALASFGILCSVGIAVDYVNWQRMQTHLQSAADVASLAAVQQLRGSDWTSVAVEYIVSDYVTANTANLQNVKVTSVTVDTKSKSVTVSLQVPGQRTFTSIFQATDATIVANSTATLKVSGQPLCVLALNPTAAPSISLSGGSSWIAPDCRIQSNSAANNSVNLSGNSSITSIGNCFVGGVNQGLTHITPRPDASCTAVPDPFASVQKPVITGCDYTNLNLNTPSTLSPGTYCGGLRLANVEFNFNPGTYIIKDGTFVTSGAAGLVGNGVTFFLTGTNAGVTWSGGGTYNLSATTSGPLAGFVIYIDPNSSGMTKSHISGGGNTTYVGAMYFPKQQLIISGTGSTTDPSPFTALVADTFLYSGTSTLSVGVDPTKTSVPVPSGLYVGAVDSPYITN